LGAKLVESADDVLAELIGFRRSGYASTVDSSTCSAEPSTGLLGHMGHDPVDVDSLCARAGMSAEQVSSELLRLELDGRVTALPGGLFQRLEKGKRG
jgi:DNA processing protein